MKAFFIWQDLNYKSAISLVYKEVSLAFFLFSLSLILIILPAFAILCTFSKKQYAYIT